MNAYFIWNKKIVSRNIMFFIPVQSENNQEEERQTPWNIKLIWLTKLRDYAVLRRLNHVISYKQAILIKWKCPLPLNLKHLVWCFEAAAWCPHEMSRGKIICNPGPKLHNDEKHQQLIAKVFRFRVQRCVKNIAFRTQESKVCVFLFYSLSSDHKMPIAATILHEIWNIIHV